MPVADADAWIFFDGDYVRYRDVHLGVLTHGLLYGTGCFDGIRAYWNDERGQLYLLQPRAHYDRLHDSARILSMRLPYSTDELVEATCELLLRNDLRTDTYIRSLVFKSGEGFGLPYRDVAESVALVAVPMGKYLDTERGARCKVSTWRRVSDEAIPLRAKVTGVYVNSHLAKLEAVDAGFDEAIMLDASGHVSEGTGENIFMKRGEEWITPPVWADILEGVTRRMVMELLRSELGSRVVERPIDRSELYVCDELLLCGTGAEITPVLDVDGRAVGGGRVGDATAKLQQLFFSIARGDDDRYAGWLVPVRR
jgi:branched-chain amino acid aminotransferase